MDYFTPAHANKIIMLFAKVYIANIIIYVAVDTFCCWE